jgi:hypothetical protein
MQRLMELQELKETRFLEDFHQSVEKERQKSWHDMHIKTKVFMQGDKVLLYDSRYQKHPGKLCMHWLGPFIILEIRPSGVVKTRTTRWYVVTRMGERRSPKTLYVSKLSKRDCFSSPKEHV